MSGKPSDQKIEPLYLLGDEPVRELIENHLGTEPQAEIVAGAALGSPGPFTIGVYGDWGSGKTSLLRLARRMVEASENLDEQPIVTVWFDAWQFQNEEHPIIPLVSTIVSAVDRRLAELRSTKSHVADATINGLKSLHRALRAVAYGFSAKTTVKVPCFAEIEAGFVAKEMIEREESLKAQATATDPLIERTLYYHAFDTLETLTRQEKSEQSTAPKIVVFIDDLDRCLPPQALKLLESIKLVLAQRGFIFALAVDRRVIEGFLSRRYKQDFGVEDYELSGKSYLDKMIQLPLPLPPHRDRFQEFIQKLLDGEVLKKPQNKQVREALVPIVEVLSVGANDNPRSLIRFINSLIVDRRVWLGVNKQDPLGDSEVPMPFFAVSRILGENLKDTLFRRLVTSKKLCEQIAECIKGNRQCRTLLNSDPHENSKLKAERDFSEEISLSRSDRLRVQVLERIDDAEHLHDLLRTEQGQAWLTDHDQRDAVYNFLAAQREEEKPDPVSQKEIFESAIRESLGLSDEQNITDQHREKVADISLDTLFNNDGMRLIADLTSLEELDLMDTQVSDAGLEHLSGLTSLEYLNLMDTQVSDAGLEHLSGLSGLQNIDLDGTPVSCAGLEHLSGLTGLDSLDLSNTQVGDAGLEYLSGLTGLQDLFLRNTQVSDAGLEHLSGLTGLQRLDLSNTQVSDAGLEHLSGLTGLQRLDLINTQVGDAGLEHLSGLTGIQRLDLSNTQVRGVGLEHLSGLTGIQSLYINNTQVSDAGLEHLSGLTGIQSLYINNTQVSDAGLEHLSGLTGLQRLDLINTQVGDAGLEHLSGLTGLLRLTLDGTRVSDIAKQQLNETLPDCNIS